MDSNVSRPITFVQTEYLNNCWMDYQEIWYIHGSQTMCHNDFGDPQTSLLAPSSGLVVMKLVHTFMSPSQ